MDRRQSKKRQVIKSSLRGLSSKHYSKFMESTKNPVALCKPYLPENIWKKFDRHKPVTQEQADIIMTAMNMAFYNIVKNDLPYLSIVPKFTTRLTNIPGRRILIFGGSDMVKMPTVSTENGSVYLASNQTISYDGNIGRFGFSTHAIERIKERIPALTEIAKNKDNAVMLFLFRKTIKDAIIEIGDKQDPQLKLSRFGYVPMIWNSQHKIWIGTTFLDANMKGTGKNEKDRLSAAMKELTSKFDVSLDKPSFL